MAVFTALYLRSKEISPYASEWLTASNVCGSHRLLHKNPFRRLLDDVESMPGIERLRPRIDPQHPQTHRLAELIGLTKHLRQQRAAYSPPTKRREKVQLGQPDVIRKLFLATKPTTVCSTRTNLCMSASKSYSCLWRCSLSSQRPQALTTYSCMASRAIRYVRSRSADVASRTSNSGCCAIQLPITCADRTSLKKKWRIDMEQ